MTHFLKEGTKTVDPVSEFRTEIAYYPQSACHVCIAKKFMYVFATTGNLYSLFFVVFCLTNISEIQNIQNKSKGENIKAIEFYQKIFTMNNLHKDLYNHARSQLTIISNE